MIEGENYPAQSQSPFEQFFPQPRIVGQSVHLPARPCNRAQLLGPLGQPQHGQDELVRQRQHGLPGRTQSQGLPAGEGQWEGHGVLEFAAQLLQSAVLAGGRCRVGVLGDVSGNGDGVKGKGAGWAPVESA